MTRAWILFIFLVYFFSGETYLYSQDKEDVLAFRRLFSLHEKGEESLVQYQGTLFLSRYPDSQYRSYVLIMLGDLAACHGQEAQALSFYTQLKGTPLEIQGEIKTGKILIQNRKWKESKIQLTEALKKNGAHSQAYQIDLLLAQVAISDKDFASYATHLEEACKKNPELSEQEGIHHQLFKAYYQLEKYTEAALQLKEIYQQHPETLTAEEKQWLGLYADQHPHFLSEKENHALIAAAYSGYGKRESEISRCEFEGNCDFTDPEVERRLVNYIQSHPLLDKDDPLLCPLQRVVHCRVFAHEPNHFEAALELVEIRYKDNLTAWYSNLLSFKEWFHSKEDIPARDYHTAKDAKRGGFQLYEGYMLLIDGELTRLEAEIAFQEGREGEGRKKRGIAVKIYKKVLHSAYGITPYLLNKAKERMALLEQQES